MISDIIVICVCFFSLFLKHDLQTDQRVGRWDDRRHTDKRERRGGKRRFTSQRQGKTHSVVVSSSFDSLWKQDEDDWRGGFDLSHSFVTRRNYSGQREEGKTWERERAIREGQGHIVRKQEKENNDIKYTSSRDLLMMAEIWSERREFCHKESLPIAFSGDSYTYDTKRGNIIKMRKKITWRKLSTRRHKYQLTLSFLVDSLSILVSLSPLDDFVSWQTKTRSSPLFLLTALFQQQKTYFPLLHLWVWYSFTDFTVRSLSLFLILNVLLLFCPLLLCQPTN